MIRRLGSPAAAGVVFALLLWACEGSEEARDAVVSTALGEAASAAEREFDYPTAASHYRTLHERHPDKVEALLGFARNLRYSGSPKDAVRVLKDADETVTDRNDVLLERAKAQLAASMINDARETLDRLLGACPSIQIWLDDGLAV